MRKTVSPAADKTVLVVDDDDVVRTVLVKSLEKSGFKVKESTGGVEAQGILKDQIFDVIVADINMPGALNNGIELLHWVKKNKPIPFILMTGFAELCEAKEGYKLGADGFLAKPVQGEDLYDTIAKILHFPSPEEIEETDADFCRLGIDDFIFGREIKYNIFVRLSPNRFVKVAHSGQDLTPERIQSYKAKSIRFFYLKRDDFYKYLQFNLVLTKAASVVSNVDYKKKMQFIQHTGELMLEHLQRNEIDTESAESAKAVVESTVTVVTQERDMWDLINVLNTHTDWMYAQSLGVCYYSILIAKSLGWNSVQTLFKISIAALFHDIGLKEIDRSILEKSRAALSIEEVKLFESHPARGIEILARVPNFSDETLQVVLQHHENCNGTGFPSKVKKNRIQPMARLIAVADKFCDLVIVPSGVEKLEPAKAIERLFVLYGETLDLVFLVELAKLFKLNPKPWLENLKNVDMTGVKL